MIIREECRAHGIAMAERQKRAGRSLSMGDRESQYASSALVDRAENQDNRDYNNEASGNSDYCGCHTEGQVLLTKNGGRSSPIGFGAGAVDGRDTDSDVEAYLSNHSVADEYRDAGRVIEYNV